MIYVTIYLLAIILANLAVSRWGPNAAIIVAFLLIGLDLTSRDKLHELWRGNNLVLKMALLIFAGSFFSWLLNRQTKPVAIASFTAFALAATTDTITYHILRDKSRWVKINGSNVLSAAVDSLVFPTMAFHRVLWGVIAGQFFAKVLGGAIWACIIAVLETAPFPRRDLS